MNYLDKLKANTTKLVGYLRNPYPKIITIVTAAIIIAALMVFLVSKFIDPNRYKPDIENYIFVRTGQTVLLQGNVKLSYLPSPALIAENIIFKNKAITASILKIYPNIKSLFLNKKNLELALFDVQYKSYRVPELYTTISFEQGLIELKSTKCGLMKGKKQGSVEIDTLRIDINGTVPKYYLKHQGKNFPLAFFIWLSGADNSLIDGKDTHLNLELTAEGDDYHPIKKTLTGIIEMEVFQGKFYGTDLISSLKKAKSFVGTLATKITSPLVSALETLTNRDHHPEGVTPFSNFKINAKLKNGIFHTHDLKIDHHAYTVHGRGYINLHNHKVDYQIAAVYKDSVKENGKHKIIHSAPLMIDITGHIQKPVLKTDFDSYLKFVKNGNSKEKSKKPKKALTARR